MCSCIAIFYIKNQCHLLFIDYNMVKHINSCYEHSNRPTLSASPDKCREYCWRQSQCWASEHLEGTCIIFFEEQHSTDIQSSDDSTLWIKEKLEHYGIWKITMHTYLYIVVIKCRSGPVADIKTFRCMRVFFLSRFELL